MKVPEIYLIKSTTTIDLLALLDSKFLFDQGFLFTLR